MLSRLAIALAALWLASAVPAEAAVPSPFETYEYIVVGSGPGGGPIAADLARAGHSVLVLEAGEDHLDDPNYALIYNFNAATNDAKTRWDFFVKHSDDTARNKRYRRMTYRQPDGKFYVGTDPPKGSEMLGVWYPRTGTLGGCAVHNAGLLEVPPDETFDSVAWATGDVSWGTKRMRKHFTNIENCTANAFRKQDHGYGRWLDSRSADGAWVGTATAPDGQRIMAAAAKGTGLTNVTKSTLKDLLNRDPNAEAPLRDQQVGIFPMVTHANPAMQRAGPGYYLRATKNDPAKYPLNISYLSLATKILFAPYFVKGKPKAVGVEYLKGKYLYSADPRHDPKEKGVKMRAYATKEVIIAAGAFNSPQLLKLSGIGPADELRKFRIPLVKNLPGVGSNLGDNYEGSLVAIANRTIDTPGGKFAVHLKTSTALAARDIYMWCGAFSFEGFWPGYPEEYGKGQYTCAFVHMKNRNTLGGYVRLRSANPQDTPDINFRHFAVGGDADLTGMLDAIKYARKFLGRVHECSGLAPWKELHPCAGTIGSAKCSDSEQKKYLQEQVYSHHAAGTCKMGSPWDPMAVVDNNFKVIGIEGLRVVDASVFPKPPGAFPVLPTMMLSGKATEAILAGK